IHSPLKLVFSQFHFTGFFEYALPFFALFELYSLRTPTFSIEPKKACVRQICRTHALIKTKFMPKHKLFIKLKNLRLPPRYISKGVKVHHIKEAFL
ncbi:MAG: hypothetical protein RSA78_08800, partial [Oscillospiraceae bacterium]